MTMYRATSDGPVALTPEEEAAWLAEQEEIVAPRRLIPKSLVQERVNAIGKLALAFGALNSDPISFGRWFAPDWPNVYADDPGLLTILDTIGCSPEQVEAITAPV
jgi:hypothetical protein